MMGGIGKGIHAVLCVNRLGYIGRGGGNLYSFKADIGHFKELTIGSAVVMGRGTFVSMGRKPLKDRLNIVLSAKEISGVKEGVLFCETPTDVLDEFGRSPFRNLYVIGGAKTLTAFLPFIDSIDLTMVEDDAKGDVQIDLNEILRCSRKSFRCGSSTGCRPTD